MKKCYKSDFLSNSVLLRPIRLVMGYLLFTLLVFCCMYTNEIGGLNVLHTSVICIVFFISFFLGYATKSRKCIQFDKQNFWRSTRELKKTKCLFLVCCVLNIIICIVNIFSFYPSVKVILKYLISPGEAYEYVKYLRNYDLDGGSFELSSGIGRLLTLCSFSKYIVFSFLLLYWKDYKKLSKIIGLLSCFIYIIQAFLMGAMINIAIMLFSTTPFFMLYRKKKKNKDVIAGIVFVIVICLCLCYFLGNRFVQSGMGFWNVVSKGFEEMMFYIAHGYVGLTYTFELPYISTLGQTTFYGIARKLNGLLGINSTWDMSYLVRNQQINGWNALSVWSTVFPWLASDFSYYLVPLIMFMMGKFGRMIWIDCVVEKNPYAIVMMGQFFIFSFMIPANNQLFHTWGNAVGALILLFMYLFSKVKIKW